MVDFPSWFHAIIVALHLFLVDSVNVASARLLLMSVSWMLVIETGYGLRLSTTALAEDNWELSVITGPIG